MLRITWSCMCSMIRIDYTASLAHVQYVTTIGNLATLGVVLNAACLARMNIYLIGWSTMEETWQPNPPFNFGYFVVSWYMDAKPVGAGTSQVWNSDDWWNKKANRSIWLGVVQDIIIHYLKSEINLGMEWYGMIIGFKLLRIWVIACSIERCCELHTIYLL